MAGGFITEIEVNAKDGRRGIAVCCLLQIGHYNVDMCEYVNLGVSIHSYNKHNRHFNDNAIVGYDDIQER